MSQPKKSVGIDAATLDEVAAEAIKNWSTFRSTNEGYLGVSPSTLGVVARDEAMKRLKAEPLLHDVYAPTSSAGVKHDNQKPDMTDIPMEAMWQMGQAFSHGQKKYGKNNYRLGMSASRQLAAAVRHIYQHLSGQTLDSESGVTHLGHALASIAMACYTIANHPNMDDRHPQDKAKHDKA